MISSQFSGQYQYDGRFVDVDHVGSRVFMTDRNNNPVFQQPLHPSDFLSLVSTNKVIKVRGGQEDVVTVPNPESLTDDVRQQYFMNEYCKALDRTETPSSRRTMDMVINALAPRLGDTRKPSTSKLYRHYKKWKATAFAAGTARKSGGSRGSYADQDNQDLFLGVVDDHYLCLSPKSVRECYRLFGERFSDQKRDGLIEAKVKPISRSTFYSWIKQIPLDTVIEAQQGKVEANKYRRKASVGFVSKTILERVEIDAVHINIGLKDAEGNCYSTAILYAAIDVCSRMILGYHLQVGATGGETLDGYRHCIINAVSPKDDPVAWPAHGLPDFIVGDAAVVLNSDAFALFKNHIGVSMINTPAGRPWHKPFIERWFATLRAQLLVSLSTYAGKRQKPTGAAAANKQKDALPISEFKQLLHDYVVHAYNNNAHAGLSDQSPNDVWKAMAGSQAIPLVPSNIEELRHLRCYTDTVTLGRHGVTRIGVDYFNDDLHRAAVKAGDLDEGVKVDIYFDKADLGAITVLYKNELFEAKALRVDLSGVSEAQLKEARANNAVPRSKESPVTPKSLRNPGGSSESKSNKKRKPVVNNGKANIHFGAQKAATKKPKPTTDDAFDASKLTL